MQKNKRSNAVPKFTLRNLFFPHTVILTICISQNEKTNASIKIILSLEGYISIYRLNI